MKLSSKKHIVEVVTMSPCKAGSHLSGSLSREKKKITYSHAHGFNDVFVVVMALSINLRVKQWTGGVWLDNSWYNSLINCSPMM